jgi:hypothetical protein
MILGGLVTEGQSRILTTGGKAVTIVGKSGRKDRAASAKPTQAAKPLLKGLSEKQKS